MKLRASRFPDLLSLFPSCFEEISGLGMIFQREGSVAATDVILRQFTVRYPRAGCGFMRLSNESEQFYGVFFFLLFSFFLEGIN